MWTDKLIKKLAEFVELHRKYKVEFHGFNIVQDVTYVSLEHRTFELDNQPYGGRMYDLDRHKLSDFKVIQLLELEEWYED